MPALGNFLAVITLDFKGTYFGIAMAASPSCDVKVAKVTRRPSVMCSDIQIGGESNKLSEENSFSNWTFKCICIIICLPFFPDTGSLELHISNLVISQGQSRLFPPSPAPPYFLGGIFYWAKHGRVQVIPCYTLMF